ncbi:MAG: Smr/MutS family protein [Ottowia sp.]|nr:Smr/MutS family protein [Ottowia sp.]
MNALSLHTPEAAQHSGHALFLRAMQGVQPLHTPARHVPAPRTAPPLRRGARRSALPDAAASAPFSDAFEAPCIEEAHGWRRAGIGPDVLRRLRRGTWRVQAQLDLHGLRVDEARTALATFLHRAAADGLRCVRIIHGKGTGSAGGRSVLGPLAVRWLQQAPQVRAFVAANPAAGGSGALLALLARPATPQTPFSPAVP